MRSPEHEPMTSEVAGALLAVDATLAGEPVDPQYAELAELALILRRDLPEPSEAFVTALDRRVERQFAVPARPRPPRRRRWLFAPGAAAVVAGVLAVLVVTVGGGAGPSSSTSPAFAGASSTATVSSSSSASAASSASPPAVASAPSQAKPLPARDLGSAVPAGKHASAGRTSVSSAGTSSGAAGTSSASSAGGGSSAALPSPTSAGGGSSAAAAVGSPAPAAGTSGPGGALAPGPVSTGSRQIVQSAQLQLTTAPNRIDDVAQQVFDVVGDEKGIVNSSNVTATGNADGAANFQLSVPSANLPATLTALSELHGAHVVSRTDTTADITGQVGGAGQRLAEARALRRSLLKQLAAATTTEQVDSLKLQLRDADASISSDLSTLRGLQRQVAYSKITLSIQAAVIPGPVPAKGSSFTIGLAAHDAGRVLVVVAGVALITLAILLPVGLVAALLAWVGFAVRRRRRDQALDLV